jgi:hypothetical protein
MGSVTGLGLWPSLSGRAPQGGSADSLPRQGLVTGGAFVLPPEGAVVDGAPLVPFF